MNYIVKILWISILLLMACAGNIDEQPNFNPIIVSLKATLIDVNTYTHELEVIVTDPENDPLTYAWDFGDGTTTTGGAIQNHTFAEGDLYLVKVTVSDGQNTVSSTTTINTKVITIRIDPSETFQTIDGFGGYGAAIPFFLNPNNTRFNMGDGYFDEAWLTQMVDDWGITILRDNITEAFEAFQGEFDASRQRARWQKDTQGNNIPTTNTYYNGKDTPTGPIGTSITSKVKYAKALKNLLAERGEELKYIASCWSPPAWMKTNGDHMKGSLKAEHQEDFANMLVKYVQEFESLSGIEMYAISIQNEPTLGHPEWTFGCVYDGNQYRDVLKLVKEKFIAAGLNTKFFGPETVRFFSRMTTIMDPVFADPVAHTYMDIIATHGYGGDGVTSSSASANDWLELYQYSQTGGSKPLWMTESTNGGGWEGGFMAGKRIFSALKFGKVSAWLWWALGSDLADTNPSSGFTKNGVPAADQQKYWASKNFFRYIRPGAIHTKSVVSSDELAVIAFQHPTNNTTTLVIINEGEEKRVVLEGPELSKDFDVIETSVSNRAQLVGTIQADTPSIVLTANSITTLQASE